MKRMKKPMIAVLLTVLIATPQISGIRPYSVHEVKAATFEEINQAEVFLKQINGDKQCTLVAVTMLIRRAAMLMGDTGWADISVAKVMEQAWIEGLGLRHSFSYGGITVDRAVFGADPVNEAIAFLQMHPEGIVIYDQIRTPRSHAVLLTDYTYESFYSADPSDAIPAGRIPNASSLVQVADAEYYWYVSSPSLMLTPSSITEENNPAIIDKDGATVIDSNSGGVVDSNNSTVIDGKNGTEMDHNRSAEFPPQAGNPDDRESKPALSTEAAVDILNKIKITLSKQQIQKGKTAKVKVTLPDSLEAVKEFSGDSSRAYKEVKISYLSANKKIASINASGKITGKKKGSTTIYAIAEFDDGSLKLFELGIKVK